jgi:hypothetical protein
VPQQPIRHRVSALVEAPYSECKPGPSPPIRDQTCEFNLGTDEPARRSSANTAVSKKCRLRFVIRGQQQRLLSTFKNSPKRFGRQWDLSIGQRQNVF